MRKPDQRKWILVSFMAIMLGCVSAFADWPQFRGPNANGVSSASVPIHFGLGRNEFWSTEIGPGHSSPVVSGGSVFVTTFDKTERRLSLVSIDRKTGKQNWVRSVIVDVLERGHPSFNPASSTPAADGDCVVAYFGSYGLLCFGYDGEKRWELRLPLTKSYAGNATSPIIAGNKVILYRGNYVDHYLLAVDKQSGKEIWKTPQAEPFHAELACTAVPVVYGAQLVVHSARSVQGFDIETGKELWVTKCATTATSSPLIVKDRAVVAAWNKMGEPVLRPEFPSYRDLLGKHDSNQDGRIDREEYPTLWIFHRPAGAEAPQNGATVRFGGVDRDKDGYLSDSEWDGKLSELERFREGYKSHGLLSVPLDQNGVMDGGEVITLETQGIPEVPTPVSDGELVYMIKNGGQLTCIDLKAGKRVHRMRTGGRGTHYASPIIAGEYLYSADGNGRVSVLSLGAKPKVIATNELGDKVYATPAADDGVLYIRTHSKLYAFAKAE